MEFSGGGGVDCRGVEAVADDVVTRVRSTRRGPGWMDGGGPRLS